MNYSTVVKAILVETTALSAADHTITVVKEFAVDYESRNPDSSRGPRLFLSKKALVDSVVPVCDQHLAEQIQVIQKREGMDMDKAFLAYIQEGGVDNLQKVACRHLADNVFQLMIPGDKAQT